MDEKFDELMREIRQSRREVEEKLSTSIAELKSQVNSAQQKTSQDLRSKEDRKLQLPVQTEG